MLDPNDRAGYLAIPITRELYQHQATDQAIVAKIAFYRELLMAPSRPFDQAENPTQAAQSTIAELDAGDDPFRGMVRVGRRLYLLGQSHLLTVSISINCRCSTRAARRAPSRASRSCRGTPRRDRRSRSSCPR